MGIQGKTREWIVLRKLQGTIGNQGNMREMFVFVSSINQFPNMLKEICKKAHYAHNEFVGFHFP